MKLIVPEGNLRIHKFLLEPIFGRAGAAKEENTRRGIPTACPAATASGGFDCVENDILRLLLNVHHNDLWKIRDIATGSQRREVSCEDTENLVRRVPAVPRGVLCVSRSTGTDFKVRKRPCNDTDANLPKGPAVLIDKKGMATVTATQPGTPVLHRRRPTTGKSIREQYDVEPQTANLVLEIHP